MSPKIEVVEMPAQRVAVVKVKTSPQNIGDDQRKCFQQVLAYLHKNAAQPAGPPISFYYSMESATAWNIGAGFPVAVSIAGDGTVEVVEIPAGKVATLLHVGPYHGLKESWNALEVWHKDQGYQVGKNFVCWESYLTGSDTEPDESKLQTRLCWLL